MNRSHNRPPKPSRRFLKFQELIALVCDVSPSMAESFRLANRELDRLTGLKEAATLWLTQKASASQYPQVCLIGFHGRVKLQKAWTPLTRLNELITTIKSLCPQGSGTNIAGALELAMDQLAAFQMHPRTQRHAKLVLITDGAGNVDVHKHEFLIARARRDRVKLNTIAIMNREDPPQSYDRDLLLRMARLTGGTFATAHDLDQLKLALQRTN